MGPLAPTSPELLYLDSNCIIYSIEKIEPYFSMLERVWHLSGLGKIEIVCSELVLLETLVKPVREHDALMESLFRELLQASGDVKLIPISQAVLERAISLRANAGLKTPDAIHAATAMEVECSAFLTNDSSFGRLEALHAKSLSEIADLFRD